MAVVSDLTQTESACWQSCVYDFCLKSFLEIRIFRPSSSYFPTKFPRFGSPPDFQDPYFKSSVLSSWKPSCTLANHKAQPQHCPKSSSKTSNVGFFSPIKNGFGFQKQPLLRGKINDFFTMVGASPRAERIGSSGRCGDQDRVWLSKRGTWEMRRCECDKLLSSGESHWGNSRALFWYCQI